MSSVKITGNASGAGVFEIAAPNSATNRTQTLPDATGTVVLDSATQTLTNKTLTAPAISSAVLTTMASSVVTPATSQASTSGTNIDFTGIPSWVERITVMLNGVSTNGTNLPLIQLGTSGGVVATGYTSFADSSYGSGVAQTTGFGIERISTAAASRIGLGTITNITGNTWVFAYNGVQAGSNICLGAGSIALGGTLDRIRITTVGGTDTFDAGTINILYE